MNLDDETIKDTSPPNPLCGIRRRSIKDSIYRNTCIEKWYLVYMPDALTELKSALLEMEGLIKPSNSPEQLLQPVFNLKKRLTEILGYMNHVGPAYTMDRVIAADRSCYITWDLQWEIDRQWKKLDHNRINTLKRLARQTHTAIRNIEKDLEGFKRKAA